ncbi:MAG TPA: hypothetical protein VMM13_10845, partial [Euzebya sp.]|nr:hypothetical protein [Euzebya sp.]
MSADPDASSGVVPTQAPDRTEPPTAGQLRARLDTVATADARRLAGRIRAAQKAKPAAKRHKRL